MSDESATYTVGFKTHGGYDSSLLAVRGDTVQEFADNISALHDDLLSLVVDTENLLHAAHSLKTPDAPAPATTSTASAPAQAANNVVMMCPHGKRARREGDGPKGHWVGYFCPLPKGDSNQCKPEWEDKK